MFGKTVITLWFKSPQPQVAQEKIEISEGRKIKVKDGTMLKLVMS